MRIVSTLALVGALVAAPAAAEVFGTWKTAPNDKGVYLHVNVQQCGANVCGKITKNVGGQKQEIVGKWIIQNMVSDGPNKWDDGSIWKPDDDETYDAEMELNGDVLKVSGCVLGGLICKSQNWTRLK